MRTSGFVGRAAVAAALVIAGISAAPVGSAPPTDASPPQDAAGYWTQSRRADAQPRDLVLDDRGLAYIQAADGSLRPHGHSTPAEPTDLRAVPTARPTKPGGGGGGTGGTSDTTAPVITEMLPAQGATVADPAAFSATVTDASGVKSVTVYVANGAQTWSFAASALGGDRWGVSLTGLTDGSWTWWATATDTAKRGGNSATSTRVDFTVSTVPAPDPGGIVTNAAWSAGGAVQSAAGRIYFEMPANTAKTRWNGYVCSGTVVTDGTTGRSVILTAAHCVYDDAYKAFARNVLFIPDQAGTTGTGTDRDCSNDLYGCWEPSFGVVDDDWTTRVFPDNIPWDYAFYVVGDVGAHVGDQPVSEVLDAAVGSLPASFAAPTAGQVTHALGYSYSEDPEFMYCAEPMAHLDAANWWLASCGLSGGSSGGPWIQPMNEDGGGPIISVNSWGYTNQPGMAGPKLAGTSASCLFGVAKSVDLNTSAGEAPACAGR